MDSHYGHLSDVLGMDKYSKDRVMTCGLDRQVIFWKINEDSELSYRSSDHFTDTLNVINAQLFVTGSHSDNCLDLWTMAKKKAVFSLPYCHAPGSWLLSTDVVHNSDLMASGGWDGAVNLYKLDKDAKKIKKINSIKGVNGSINCLKFCNVNRSNYNSIMIAASNSQEQRFGRWNVDSKVKDGITIIRKKQH